MNTHEHAMILPASPDFLQHTVDTQHRNLVSRFLGWTFLLRRTILQSLCIILFLGGLFQVAQTFPLQQGYFQLSVYTTCPEFLYSPPPLLTPHSS